MESTDFQGRQIRLMRLESVDQSRQTGGFYGQRNIIGEVAVGMGFLAHRILEIKCLFL